MARPKTLDDIEVRNEVEFASIDINKIADRGDLLKAYGAFMEAVQKAGCTIDVRYNTAAFVRKPSDKELAQQLADAQTQWDGRQTMYKKWASGEELRYEHEYNYAKQHAQDEGLPMFPWEMEGRRDPDLEDTLKTIDECERGF
jgi:hypothetical protein